MRMMNLFLKEFRWNLKSLLIWIIIFVAFALMYIPITDHLIAQADDMIQFMERLPEVLLQMFHLDTEIMTRPEGIFGGEGMSFVYILSAIFAAMMANSLFAKEFENKTIEYLLVKPVSRTAVYISKLAVILACSGILISAFTFSIIGLFSVFIDVTYNVRLLYGFGLYALAVQLFFAGISSVIAILSQKSAVTISLSIGLVIFMYFGDTLSSIFDQIRWLGRLTVFNYIPLVETIKNDNVMVGNALLIMLSSVVFFAIALWAFRRIDVKV